MTNEFLLQDRLQKIKQIIGKYGEDNFYVSFSGGKDSVVLSVLIDMALPDNRIPRVFSNTGIELNMIRDFVMELAKTDERIQIIQPGVPIKQMLEEVGYPFKSKEHAFYLSEYQRAGERIACYDRYLNPAENRKSFGCPKKLRYQFTEDFKLKVSNKCCHELKKKPLKKWQKENKRPFSIVGIMADEGGMRKTSKCLAFERGKLRAFQPLVPVTKEWEDWFIEEYKVQICDIYKPPYNFERTGCKGCPFALELQEELDILEKFFPNERKQCEFIWKPVYDEYRRLNYRLKANRQMELKDFFNEGDDK